MQVSNDFKRQITAPRTLRVYRASFKRVHGILEAVRTSVKDSSPPLSRTSGNQAEGNHRGLSKVSDMSSNREGERNCFGGDVFGDVVESVDVEGLADVVAREVFDSPGIHN